MVSAGPVSVAERDALGTTVRVAIWPRGALGGALAAVTGQVERLDAAASRFRADSEISAVQKRAGEPVVVSAGLAEAVTVALAAAQWTGGLVDPTIGARLVALGYDRDFVQLREQSDWPAATEVPGWREVRLAGRTLSLPAGVVVDLGATAKGLGADWSAQAALAAGGCGGVLVSLGGDLAAAGECPAGGWPVLIADDHRHGAPGQPGTQTVRLLAGGLATSSVTGRRWRRCGRELHHIIDPRTGEPAGGPWRTVSVAGATGADANAAATAAIIAGAAAPAWLDHRGITARLISHSGQIVRTGGWPAADGGVLPPRSDRWLAADAVYTGVGDMGLAGTTVSGPGSLSPAERAVLNAEALA